MFKHITRERYSMENTTQGQEPVVQEQDTQSEQSVKAQESQLEACQAELKSWKDKALTISADFENYKKRLIKERQQLREQAILESASKLLPQLDNLERALAQEDPTTPEQLKAWKDGFAMIYTGLGKALDQLGVSEITELTTFDPELHEAVMSVVAEGQEPGAIVALVQKGYRIGNRVIRPAKVTVAQ